MSYFSNYQFIYYLFQHETQGSYFIQCYYYFFWCLICPDLTTRRPFKLASVSFCPSHTISSTSLLSGTTGSFCTFLAPALRPACPPGTVLQYKLWTPGMPMAPGEQLLPGPCEGQSQAMHVHTWPCLFLYLLTCTTIFYSNQTLQGSSWFFLFPYLSPFSKKEKPGSHHSLLPLCRCPAVLAWAPSPCWATLMCMSSETLCQATRHCWGVNDFLISLRALFSSPFGHILQTWRCCIPCPTEWLQDSTIQDRGKEGRSWQWLLKNESYKGPRHFITKPWTTDEHIS